MTEPGFGTQHGVHSLRTWNTKERCGTLETEQGEVIEGGDYEGKCKVFLQHNIICGEPPPLTEQTPTRCTHLMKEAMGAVKRALAKTKSSSAPGPDRVTWRLQKALKDTRLGTAVLEVIGQMADVGNRYYAEEKWREMVMVMSLKPRRDRSKVKGWRPMVLLNVIGKLTDKVVAERMMKKEELFHARAFAGWMGRGAIDSVKLIDEIRKKAGGDVYGRDIKPAFNSLDGDVMRKVLREHEGLRDRVDYFMRPRTFDVKVNRRVIGKGMMVGGTPQGSPLSPTLFTAYMSSMVWEAERLLRHGEEETKHRMEARSQRPQLLP